MKTVNFTKMIEGTKEEYLLLDEYEQDYIKPIKCDYYTLSLLC